MLAESSCSLGFVCYLNDDVDSLARKVGPVCLLHSNCAGEGSTLFHDRTLAGRPSSWASSHLIWLQQYRRCPFAHSTHCSLSNPFCFRSVWCWRSMVGGFCGMLLLSAKHSGSLVWWEDTLWKAVQKTIWRQSYPVWSGVGMPPYFCKRPLTTSIWSARLAMNIPWICVYTRVWIWKGDFLIADIEELEQMDASEIHARRLNAKEVLTTQCRRSVNAHERWQFHIPSRRWNSKNFWRRSTSENIHLNPGSSWKRRRTRNPSRRNRRTLFSTSTSRRLKAGWCGCLKWCLVYYGRLHSSHHVEPNVKLYVPREESFLNPLKYIDVTRNTHTSLDVLMENIYIDDYWNVDGDRRYWKRNQLTRKQTTSRPEELWTKMWNHMSECFKKLEKILAWQLTNVRNKKEIWSKKKELWQNRDLQLWTCLQLFRQVPHPRKFRLHPKAGGNS